MEYFFILIMVIVIGFLIFIMKKQKDKLHQIEETHLQKEVETQNHYEEVIKEKEEEYEVDYINTTTNLNKTIEQLKVENEDIRRNFKNRGEIQTHKTLEKIKNALIENYQITDKEIIIMPNIFIPTDNGRTRQLDHLVLLPTGLCIIETKHWKGNVVLGMTKKKSEDFPFLIDIINNMNEDTLIFDKDDKGNPEIKLYKDPLKQVNLSAAVLSNYLKQKNIRAGWIRTIVFFNYTGMKLYDWSNEKTPYRITDEETLMNFFREEITKNERKFSVEELEEIKLNIEKTNYIQETIYS